MGSSARGSSMTATSTPGVAERPACCRIAPIPVAPASTTTATDTAAAAGAAAASQRPASGSVRRYRTRRLVRDRQPGRVRHPLDDERVAGHGQTEVEPARLQLERDALACLPGCAAGGAANRLVQTG